MKLFFHLFKIFSFFLLICSVILSCQVIKITDSDATTRKLTMIDKAGNPADTFVIFSGQKIKWKIKDSKVKSISNMPPKDSELYDVFKRHPHKKFLAKSWKGKVIKTKTTVKEQYNIDWTDSTGTTYTYDPLIQVNPR